MKLHNNKRYADCHALCLALGVIGSLLIFNAETAEAASKRQTQEISPGILQTIPVSGSIPIKPQSSSGLPVRVTSTSTKICAVKGYQVSGLRAGSCILLLSQAGNKIYLPAPKLRVSLAVEVSPTPSCKTNETLVNNVCVANPPNPTDCSFPVNVVSKCKDCHTAGKLAGQTKLVFPTGGTTQANEKALKDYFLTIGSSSQAILSKIAGVGHGGGVIFPTSSPEYASMACYLNSLTAGGSGPPPPVDIPVNSDNLFAPTKSSSSSQILRRASVILAGRPPTKGELDQVSSGDLGSLRKTIKGLMQGQAFRGFIIRGANDRLLTDAFINGGIFLEISDPNSFYYPILAEKQYSRTIAGNKNYYIEFGDKLSSGLARSPLELIYFIVSNDRSYTEILTADYMMLNPQASEIYRSGLTFDSDDPSQFKPGKNFGQIFNDKNLIQNYIQDFGNNITQHGGFIDVPIVGILSTGAFLDRYPTTDTNRNRARARWTFKHFLGIDIEKSASRTTDPIALADKNNPTMLNPNCTVCHQNLDPVAASFEDWDEKGYYRSGWLGLDSLPATYKYPPKGQSTQYVNGDLWFRDMRPPGLLGSLPNTTTNPLRWLAEEIVKKDEFATAAITFWWPAIMGVDALSAPENMSDVNYQAQLAAFEAQQKDIRTLGQLFKTGNSNVRPFNLRDILVEMMLTPWFASNSVTAKLTDPQESSLSGVGAGRLLTPEELDAKTTNITGVIWGQYPSQNNMQSIWNLYHPDNLLGQYQVTYGGIDSMSVAQRSREMNALMSNVATKLAIEVACEAVLFDFGIPDGSRRLFNGISKNDTPATKTGETIIRAKLADLHGVFWGALDAADSAEVTKSYELLKSIWNNRVTKKTNYLAGYNDEICLITQDTFSLKNISAWPSNQNFWDAANQKQRDNLMQDNHQMLVTWKNMLIGFITDYRYLHE